MMYLIIILTGILSGTISGIIGTGSSIILLPALAYAFGTKSAVPIMAIASIIGNISRVILWRKEINIPAFLLYSIPAFPAAILGANTLWVMPVKASNICIGFFFLMLIPVRYWAKRNALTLNKIQLALSGMLIGYLTGVVFSTGPLTIPIFSGFGLTKGALLSTEAAASFSVYLAKALAFGTIGAIPKSVFINGVLVGVSLIVGIFIGKKFVLGMSEKIFNFLIDAMMLIAGVSMLLDALR